MAGSALRLRVAAASPPAGALSAWGRCFARAALFGADKLRKPGRRMEGSVQSLELRAAALCGQFPRGGDPGKCPAAPGSAGMSWIRGWLRASSSLIQQWEATVVPEVRMPDPRLRSYTDAAPSSQCIQCPLGLPRLPWGAGQGVEPSGCSLNLKAPVI